MSENAYFMQGDQETRRLEIKTDKEAVRSQALWAGVQPGMRVADLGCGPGVTTRILHDLVQPGGRVVGVDVVEDRIAYARAHYPGEGIDYVCADIRDSLDHLGRFDRVWLRFVLEYHGSKSFDIVRRARKILRPGGKLCLIDLDHNCLTHYGFSARFERAYRGIMDGLTEKTDFDPYVGRKLYSFLYDLGCRDIRVQMTAHHLIYGKLRSADAINWTRKVEMASSVSGYAFPEYEGGYKAFFEEFTEAFSNPRRFTYTPVIVCTGTPPH